MESTIRIFIKSQSQTIQAADMDTLGHPVCTGSNPTNWGNATGKAGRMIPEEHRILLDAVSRASERLDCEVEVIDISEYGFFQRRKLKGIIPRVEIGDRILTGLPTSDEIVACCQ